MHFKKINYYEKFSANWSPKGPNITKVSNSLDKCPVAYGDTKLPGYEQNPDFHNTNPISILKRQNSLTRENGICPENHRPFLGPRLPYHKRMEAYMERRNRIFNISSLNVGVEIKTTTLRLRKFYRTKKLCKRFLVSTIISNPKDRRYYAKIAFLEFVEYGLLDTGANISCIDADLAKIDFTRYSHFVKCKSYVRTADGQSQPVLGWLETAGGYYKTGPR